VPPERDGAGISAITAHPGAPEQAGIVDAAAAAVSGQDAGAAHAALPGILSSVPVAVLVIDQKNSAVTYANTAAVELAGNVALPVDVDQWGWSCGFYPEMKPGQHRSGSAENRHASRKDPSPVHDCTPCLGKLGVF